MTKLKVELNASYGYDCSECGYGSEETIEMEVNEMELEALRKIGTDNITRKAVVEAIDNGAAILQSLHKKLEEKFYYMVEEYWLYEADNECLEECLAEHIEQDISDGIYTPTTSEDDYEDEDEEDEDYEDDDDYEDDEDYDLDAYYDWVCGNGHDHAFVAERVGVDLDACRDDEVNYTITLSE